MAQSCLPLAGAEAEAEAAAVLAAADAAGFLPAFFAIALRGSLRAKSSGVRRELVAMEMRARKKKMRAAKEESEPFPQCTQ